MTGWRARIGLLALLGNATVEPEMAEPLNVRFGQATENSAQKILASEAPTVCLWP